MTQWTNPWSSSYGIYNAIPAYQAAGKREPALACDDDDWETDSNFVSYGSERDSRGGSGRQDCPVNSTSSITTDLSRSIQGCLRYRPMDKRPEVQVQKESHNSHCESKVNTLSGNQEYSKCNKSTYAKYPENAIERTSIFNVNANAAVKLNTCFDGKLKSVSETSLQSQPPQVAMENYLYENAEALYEGKEPKPAVHQVPKGQQSISHYSGREAKPLTKACQGMGQDGCIQLMASQFERNISNTKAQRETERGRQKEHERQPKTCMEAGKQDQGKYLTNKWNPVDGQNQEKGHQYPDNIKTPKEDNGIESRIYKSSCQCDCGYNQEQEYPTPSSILQVMASRGRYNRTGHNPRKAQILEDCQVKGCTACHSVNHSVKMPIMGVFHESKGPQKDMARVTMTSENWGASNPCRSLQKVDPNGTLYQVRPS
ncbi:hypothetical protein NDU88_004322 [Pleurodeles waltl]|uniref:Uncharacterized protein n=1 Tax=Pleurodeles waltl TaxID=8319 RepID=A0AAV7V4C7_PLEWA|nr:hypothetical protein NDU88_004322 [Pleurodeles waltl]